MKSEARRMSQSGNFPDCLDEVRLAESVNQ